MTKRPKARQTIAWEEFRELRQRLRNPNPAIALAANLAWYCGLRVTEITRLKWSHLGELDTLTRRMQLTPDLTKNHVARTIPIPLPLAKALIVHRQWQGSFVVRPPDDESVVTHSHNTRALTSRAIQRAFKIAAEKKGLGRVTPHSLRHTFATRLLAVSTTRLVQLALGHRSITTTELYTHPTVDDIELAMARAFVEET